ncbi:MAG: hypothetical protein KH828_02080 [Clostridiales bacterium]|nr:hypothetical protein [Clostridiales bacterium]
MFSLILKELWYDLKQKKGIFLRAFFLLVILNYMSSIVIIRFNTSGAVGQEVLEGAFETEAGLTMLLQQLMLAATVVLLIIFSMIFKDIPLRISRGIYICPAGDKEKRNYLLIQLGIKLLICLAVPCLLLYLSFGYVFISEDPVLQAVQLLLWFFTFYNINLRIGTGEKSGREVDEKGYRIVSRAEEMVTVYWLCLLILEWIGFLVFLFVDMGLGTVATLGIWGAVMLLNLFFALRYTRPLLQDMSSYEKIYCQRPPEQVVQYDI